MKSKCATVSFISTCSQNLAMFYAVLSFLSFVFISSLTYTHIANLLSSLLRTWEPAKNVKEDDPVTFFRYVDKIGLEEQSEEDSKSKLGGKTAWRKILKDGRPPMIEG